VYGNIAVKIIKDYTLRCLEYICSVASPLRQHWPLLLSLYSRPFNREDTDTCTLLHNLHHSTVLSIFLIAQ